MKLRTDWRNAPESESSANRDPARLSTEFTLTSRTHLHCLITEKRRCHLSSTVTLSYHVASRINCFEGLLCLNLRSSVITRHRRLKKGWIYWNCSPARRAV